MLIFRSSFLILFLTLAPSLASEAAEIVRFRLLPQESQILTRVSSPFGIVTGEFTIREGEAQGDAQDLQGTERVRVTIATTSYDSKIRRRNKDVKANYLETKEFPVVVFTSTGIEDIKKSHSKEKAWEFTIKGVLKLHGVERELRVPVKLIQRGKKITIEGRTKILFGEFNIATPIVLSLSSGNDVEVSFRFTGEQQPRPFYPT